MAQIRDELVLDVTQALASIREIENALNRALADVVLDVQIEGDGAEQLSTELRQAGSAADRLATDLDQAEAAADDLTAEMRGVERATDKAADEADRLGRETKAARGYAGELRDSLTKGFDIRSGVVAAVAALGAREVVQGLSSAVEAATDLAESTNAVRVIFEDASESVLQFGRDTSDAVFLASADFNQLAATTGNLLKGFGLDVQTAADLTVVLAERSADMASVFNTEVSVALEAINAALRGESEQIRRFTGSFSAEEVKRYGQALFGVTGELDDQQKVLAAVEFILAKTAAVQGDAANTAGELANQQRALTEAWTNAQAVIGGALVPALSEVVPLLVAAAETTPQFVRGAQDLFIVMEGLAGSVINFGAGLVDLATGDVSGFVGNMQDSADATARFADTLFGSRSVLRTFQSLLKDGEDNVTDYANVIDTLAGRGDLIRLFEETTLAASNAGVGVEAQASALRAVIRDGSLTTEQMRFLVAEFNKLALALDRPDVLLGNLGEQLAALQRITPAAAFSFADYGDEVRRVADIDLDTNLPDQIAEIASASEDTASSVEIVNEVIAESIAEFQALDAAVRDLPGVVQELGAAMGLTLSDIVALGEAFGAAADDAERFRELTLELADPVFAAANAAESAADAEADLADARAGGNVGEIASAEIELAKARLESDAALRALGDINLVGGRFDQSLGVLAAALETDKQTVLDILETLGVLDQTEIGPVIDFVVDDQELEDSLNGIPDEVVVAIRYEANNFAPLPTPGAVDEIDPRFGGGTLEINTTIVNPQDTDVAGSAAMAGNIIGGVAGLTQTFIGRG